MYFVSLFFLNKRNVTTTLLMMHLKCTVIDYANLNSRSKKQVALESQAAEYVISFSSISCLCLF